MTRHNRLRRLLLALALSGLPLQPLWAEALKVGVYDNPPSIQVDAQGHAQGMFADLLEEIARLEGWQLAYVPGNWADLYASLERGDLDLLTSISYSPERNQVFDFAKEPVAVKWGMVYLPRGSSVRILPDLDGKRVAVLRGGIHGQNFRRLASEFGIQPQIVETLSHAETLRWVEEGRVDAGVVNSTFGYQEEGNFAVERSAIVFSPTKATFAVPKGRHADLLATIDRYLAAWREEQGSVYYSAYRRWHGAATGVHEVLPGWVVPLLLGLGATLCLALLWRHTLTRALERRSAELGHLGRVLHGERDFSTTLLETAGALIVVVDAQGTIVRFNPAATRITGYRPLEVEHHSLWELFIPEGEQAAVRAEFATLFEQSGPVRGEYHWRMRDGTLRRFAWSHALLKQGQPRDALIVSVGTDITAYTQLQEALRERERQLTTLLNATPDIICFKDGEGRWLEANEANLQLFNLGGTPFRGKRDAELADYAAPLYRDALHACAASDARAWESHTSQRGEERIPRAEGGERIFDVIKVPLYTEDGGRQGLVVLGRDITERKLYEEQLGRWVHLFRHAAWGMLVCDAESGVLEYVNETLAHERGYTPEEMLGQPFAMMLPEGELRRVGTVMGQLYDQGHLVFESMHQRRDGTPFAVQVDATLFFDSVRHKSYCMANVQDISERRERERRLRRYEEMISTTPDLMALVDTHYTYLQVNDAYAKAYRRSKESIIGESVASVFGEERFQRLLKGRFDRCLAGEEMHIKTWVKHLDTPRYLEANLYPFREQEGGPVAAVVLSLRDITAQHQAEEQQARLATRLAIATDAARIGIWEWQFEGQRLFWDERMLAIYHLQESDFDGTPSAWYARIHPDDQARVEGAVRQALRAEVRDFTLEFRIYTPQMQLRYLAASGYVERDEGGQVTRIIGANWDITELSEARETAERNAEELHRHNKSLAFLSRAGRSFASTLDLDSVLDRVLHETMQLLHISADSSWIYERDQKELVCHHAIGTGADQVRGQRLRIGQGITGWAAINRQTVLVPDTRLDRRHYKRVDARTGVEVRSMLALPLLYRDELLGVLVCVDTEPNRFDESDVHLLETLTGAAAVAIHNARLYREMVDLHDRAEAANRAKSAFLANMSHELRTPLNAVLGYAQILLKEPSIAEAQKREIRAIRRAGDYLLMLINDILDLAKIEAGRFELFPAPCDLHGLFEQVHEQFDFRAHEKGLELRLVGLERTPLSVELDEKRLRQVVMNLLANAIKFTEAGGVILRVDYHEERLYVAVEDSGIGIDPAHIQHLFNPYAQVGDDAYRRQGTGLGLTISQSLVERMGGHIGVESRLGEGSQFSFSIPAKTLDAQVERHRNNDYERVVGYRRSDAESAPLRLLVVDDQAHNRQVIQGLLEPLGFEVEQADGGNAAIAQVEQRLPNLVLMDLVMPDLDGHTTTRILHKRHPTLKVVAVSARAFSEDRQESAEAGCVDHIPKPLELEILLNTLARQLPLEWRYSEVSGVGDEVQGHAHPLDLTRLSAGQRATLGSLVLHGSGSALNEFIDGWAEQEPGLAATLRALLDEFEYRKVLDALAALEQRPDPE